MMNKYLNILLLLVFFSLGCTEKIIPPDDIDYYKSWKSKSIHNYTIEQRRICFCPDAGDRMQIEVRSDTIYKIINLNTNEPYTKPGNSYYLTVEDLFRLILNNSDDSLVIKFNRDYSYPETLDINPQLHPVDGGVLYETNNLRIK